MTHSSHDNALSSSVPGLGVIIMAAGLGKQRMYVIPQYKLVVVRFAEATSQGLRFDDRELLKPVVEGLAP